MTQGGGVTVSSHRLYSNKSNIYNALTSTGHFTARPGHRPSRYRGVKSPWSRAQTRAAGGLSGALTRDYGSKLRSGHPALGSVQCHHTAASRAEDWHVSGQQPGYWCVKTDNHLFWREITNNYLAIRQMPVIRSINLNISDCRGRLVISPGLNECLKTSVWQF